jgi:putative nucleotidyltransferase with HDIG domain
MDQRVIQWQIGEHVATAVSAYLKSCRNQIDVIKRTLEIVDPLRDFNNINNESMKRFLEEQVRGSENLLFLRVVNMEGKGIRAGYEFTGDRTQRLLDEAFRRGRNESYYVLSPPYYVPEIDQLVAVISRSVLINGRIVGVISGVISLEPVHKFVQQGSTSANTVYMVSSEGKLLAHPDKQRMKSNEDLSHLAIVNEIQKLGSLLTTTKPFVDTSSGQPVNMLGTIVLVPEIGWGVVVQTEEKNAFYPVRQMIVETILWTLLAIALAALLSLVFSKQISVPIDLLAKATRSITAGNFADRVHIKSNNEVGELADNFNSMADKIENTIGQLQNALNENKELFFGSISAIASAIDEKDPYTRGHSERVSGYAVEIARSLGLSEAELEKVKIGGLLHDVGKIGIEDQILKKPAKFTPEEYDIMKHHPSKGAQIMGAIPQFRDMVPAMHFHHEQVDGNGYPLGLKGDQIPLIAKIISVADCFDAMTLKRVYQGQWSPEFVIEKIQGWIGTRYDPRVVDGLIKAYREGRIKVPASSATPDKGLPNTPAAPVSVEQKPATVVPVGPADPTPGVIERNALPEA